MESDEHGSPMNQAINREITKQGVLQVLTKLPNGKAAGSDGY